MNEETVGDSMTSCHYRIRLLDEQLGEITLEEMIRMWREQDFYIDSLESYATIQKAEMEHLRTSEEHMRQKLQEAILKEKVLLKQLATRAQEMEDCASQLAELRAQQNLGLTAVHSSMLDPAVNILLQRLRGELLTIRSALEETQDELRAWKFTPDSNTGKLLIAKCRSLFQENKELGAMITSGRLAKLEGELALHKSFGDEVKQSQSEMDEFLQDLDEDVEGMQSTIYYLQQELLKQRERCLISCIQEDKKPTAVTEDQECGNNQRCALLEQNSFEQSE